MTSPCLATLALRIHFDGLDAPRVLGTNQDDIQSLIPWLRDVLTSLRLPHPKPSNVIRPDDYTSVIDMYWDLASTQTLVRAVVNRCNEFEYSTLQDKSIGLLMVFVLPGQMREIPDRQSPIVMRPEKIDKHEAALLGIFRSIGLPTPTPSQDPAVYISAVTNYIAKLRAVASSEAAARVKAEEALAEERARHARILQDIQMECREPFVVPALLEAFVALSEVVDNIPDPS